MELLDVSLVNWSRAQFAMTAMYHWLFVPLTLGLGIVMALMETMYVRTGQQAWKNTAKFWMNIFGINFAIGVATGLILEFQFGTNWSNYSWFVGDIFGAPLAIEGMLAFFMEATFISIMFFGWKRVSKGAHLASTWLVVIGATLSAFWILVANGWMQYPIGMQFNPDTVRNEMVDFWAIALSPVAIQKFFHSVLSGWVLGGVFVIAVSGWYMLRKRDMDFARRSMKIGAAFGLISSLLIAFTGHGSASAVAATQPMKLAVMEGLYEGSKGEDLIAFAWLNADKKSYSDKKEPFTFAIKIPNGLSFLSFSDFDAYVPGIKDIIDGGYTKPDGTVALSFYEKQAMGKKALAALASYHTAKKAGNLAQAEIDRTILKENFAYFGYGYLDTPEQTIPNIPLVYWAFHIMVYLGGYFILLFAVVLFFIYRKKLETSRWLLWASVLTLPLGYLAGQAGWIVAEVGRQPWAIQDILPVQAALSALSSTSVKITFFLFLTLFTVLLIAEVNIMLKQIKKGPGELEANTDDK